MICAVLADTRAHARRGAAAVKVGYEDLPDPVFTVEVCGLRLTRGPFLLWRSGSVLHVVHVTL